VNVGGGDDDDPSVVISSQHPYTSDICIVLTYDNESASDAAFDAPCESNPNFVVIFPCIINFGSIYGGTLQVVEAVSSANVVVTNVGNIVDDDDDSATTVAKQREENRMVNLLIRLLFFADGRILLCVAMMTLQADK
jgi:hypothetical protein